MNVFTWFDLHFMAMHIGWKIWEGMCCNAVTELHMNNVLFKKKKEKGPTFFQNDVRDWWDLNYDKYFRLLLFYKVLCFQTKIWGSLLCAAVLLNH